MRFIIDMLLKKYVFLYLIVISQLCNVWADENSNEIYYNYYHRNPDGTFILEQIDVSGIGVDLFSYKVNYDNNVIISITGYYYQSDVVKFIDTIQYDRIVNTKYFNRFNPSVYTRVNLYRVDGFMSSVIITHEYGKDLKNGRNETSTARIFFEKDPLGLNYNYYAIRVQESDYGLLGGWAFFIPGATVNAIGNTLGRYMVSEGQVNQNYQPLYISSKTITIPSKLLNPISGELLEVYAYDSENNNVGYMYAINRRIVREYIKRVIGGVTVKHISYHNFLNNANEFYIQEDGYEARVIFDDFNGIDNKEIVDDITDIININGVDHIKKIDEELTKKGIACIIQKINNIKEDLYIKYNIDYDTYETKNKYTIYCVDEVVNFNADDGSLESRLNLDFDIYPDNGIFVNQYPDSVTSPEKRMRLMRP
jgi:hypothetical protein